MAAGIGELAAIGVALSWGVANQIQAYVGRLVGTAGIVLLRTPYASLWLGLACLLAGPDVTLDPSTLFFLFVSGMLGIAICDSFLYWAINIIGPAMSILILSTSTIFTTFFGWLFFQETLSLQAMVGIAVTISGVLWVITEHSAKTLPPGQEMPSDTMYTFGIFLALAGAVCLAGSFMFLKKAMHMGTDPLWGAFVRFLGGSIVLWIGGFARGLMGGVVEQVRQHPQVLWILVISCTCAAGGMWMASFAMLHAPAGVAATLIGLQPVAVTLIGAAWYKRRPSLRTVVGICIAFSGTALVCLR